MFQWETADPLRFSSTQLKFPWSLASLGRGFYCPQPPWPSLTVFNSFPREEKWGWEWRKIIFLFLLHKLPNCSLHIITCIEWRLHHLLLPLPIKALRYCIQTHIPSVWEGFHVTVLSQSHICALGHCSERENAANNHR